MAKKPTLSRGDAASIQQMAGAARVAQRVIRDQDIEPLKTEIIDPLKVEVAALREEIAAARPTLPPVDIEEMAYQEVIRSSNTNHSRRKK